MNGNVSAYAQPYGEPAIASSQQIPKAVEESVADYMLEVRQQPLHARVTLGKEKDRKPIDPPPILQLKVSQRRDPNQHFLQSPYFFMSCTLVKSEPEGVDPAPNSLLGTVVSSLHRLKDTDNNDGGFFVFPDLSCRIEGKFKLLFALYQMQKTECVLVTSIQSSTFQVYAAKSFPGLAESTFLTRSFSDQGVRLRVRKDSRSLTTRKRNASAVEYARKHQELRDREQQLQRKSLANVGNGTDDTLPYQTPGASFDQSPTNYAAYESEGMNKRQRIMRDDLPPPAYSNGADMSPYGGRPTYNPAAAAAAMQQMPVSTAPYAMPAQTMPAQSAGSMTYLTRIDTHHPGPGSAGSAYPNSAGPTYQSPSSYHSPPSRQSPHSGYQFTGLQGSSPSMGYQPPSATATTAWQQLGPSQATSFSE